jgi:hypothetical protein
VAYKLAAKRPLEIEDTATDVGLPQKLSFKIWMRNDRNVPNAAIPLEPKRCPLFGSRRRSLFDRDEAQSGNRIKLTDFREAAIRPFSWG